MKAKIVLIIVLSLDINIDQVFELLFMQDDCMIMFGLKIEICIAKSCKYKKILYIWFTITICPTQSMQYFETYGIKLNIAIAWKISTVQTIRVAAVYIRRECFKTYFLVILFL